MAVAFVLILLAGYMYSCGRLIRWAAKRADRDVPKWSDIVGMLMWPALLGRLSRYVIPDSWQWPEALIGLGIWIVTLLVVLMAYFKLPARYAIPMCLAILVIAVWTAFEMLKYVPSKQ